ncbi:hypothetical protein SAE02_68180 [Skermanella aerolata]|uniref:60 kDa chaperonin n=1 Tax=Skermanella aerolata TaxID=393310 RepID=A0A512E2I3_9PROT|nr:TCP-1/cpn60 chaperonin family protein [Skermanella aerolata]GEO42670.1 hypothetical protein SAE02_68180 [Skermanella aerolata]
MLELVRASNRSLLIVAENVVEAALPGILINHIRRNLCAVAVRGPGQGDSRLNRLEDLAVLTGGRAILSSQGDTLTGVTLDDLGQARKAVIGEDDTTIIGAAGAEPAIRERQSGIRFELEAIRNADGAAGSPKARFDDIEKLEERLRNLSGTLTVVKIGGISDVVIKERLQHAENARNAAAAAGAEGMLPGGGVGLLRCGRALTGLRGDNHAQDYGIDIVRKALEEPLTRISMNAGFEPAEVLFRVRNANSESWGLDARTGVYGDLFDLGVVDPAKVTRLAFQNAVGTAGMLMTAECVVTERPLQDPSFGYTPEWAARTREDPRL